MIITEIHREVESAVKEIIDMRQIVAIFQNNSEWGPRALGNRSILFDPTNPEAKEIVNLFISTSFEGGRHQRRIDKINK